MKPWPRALAALLAVTATAASSPAAGAADGKTLFAQNCAACHQTDGKGIKGAFPSLAGDALVQGPVAPMAAVVLNGRRGMPAFGGDLSNDTLAAVISYVRTAWGNGGGAVTPDEIAGVRRLRRDEQPAAALQAH